MADALTCSAGCKREAADEKAASNLGWELLPISQRWRCPECTHALQAVNEPKTDTEGTT